MQFLSTVSLLLVLITILHLNFCSNAPIEKKTEAELQEHALGQYRCDERLAFSNRSECEMVMSQNLLYQSHLKFVESINTDEPELYDLYSNDFNRRKDSPNPPECPTFTSEYLDASHEGARSPSPTYTTFDFKRHRIPQFIYQAKCQCDDCAEKGDTENPQYGRSAEMVVLVDVFYNETGTPVKRKERVSVGCTCILPF